MRSAASDSRIPERIPLLRGGISHAPAHRMPAQTAPAVNHITGAVVSASMDVHTAIGPGLFENAYVPCLCYELRQRGLSFRTQVPIPLQYKNVNLECVYRADIV